MKKRKRDNIWSQNGGCRETGSPQEIVCQTGRPAASGPGRILFIQFAEQWKEMVRYRIKASSFALYHTLLECHLTPCFGRMHLDEIDNAAVQGFIAQKRAEQYTASYIRSMTVLLQNILRNAKDLQINTSYNVPYINMPALPKSGFSTRSFSPKDWNTLRIFLMDRQDAFSFGILLCMCTGIRIGELSGLKWGDFDMETGQFFIQRTVSRIRNLNAESTENTESIPRTILNIGPPKTPSSMRRIPLPSFLTELLRTQAQHPDCFILTGTGNCMEPRTIQKRYSKCLKECHLPYLNFHSLRHSFATLGIQKGVDYRSLSEILGHSSVTTTLNIYAHSDMNRKRQCMELLWS